MTQIHIHCANGTGFVWDLEDVKTLRIKHRICGILAGTLPQASQQNVFLGLPLELLPEEVVLLVRRGIAVLVNDHKAHLQPTPQLCDEYYTVTRAKEIEKDKLEIEQKRQRDLAISEVKKSQTHEELKREMRKEKRRAEGEDQITSKESEEANKQEQEQEQQREQNSRITIRIATSSNNLVNYKALPSAIYTTIEQAQLDNIWSYPSNETESARCRIFENLWDSGYYLGSGLKFGGDFLAYPGDPLRYHSHFVVSTTTSSIQPIEIVSWGRLATAVKKSHLIGWIDENNDVQFMSLEWAGF